MTLYTAIVNNWYSTAALTTAFPGRLAFDELPDNLTTYPAAVLKDDGAVIEPTFDDYEEDIARVRFELYATSTVDIEACEELVRSAYKSPIVLPGGALTVRARLLTERRTREPYRGREGGPVYKVSMAYELSYARPE